ncbi:OmpA family protein [Clostridium tagluense]|uniref:OmpA/MotB family protein n=1 Tax=Clostridium tagluense TaxID=360422 RepID=UPI001CF35697|nr:OmpA family protein [Clostridium tagluense]MCB2313934.1 OmpA family protein [Clostridium tagluense]MCB2318751.1 OmpA family protein [Clostridium tagluense]MCB2323601.1 OmpA family protein [Clostridium tagluense]MCB2328489.1 OmpA family protein [Clostridium tagluense]MCB2333342.1 OmpA family protein [Clostridium tagluense]
MDEENNFDTEDEGINNEWLATYGDLVTLLMCFFVLLYSMAVIDQSKAKQAIASLNNMGAFSQQSGAKPSVGNGMLDKNAAIVGSAEQQMDNIYKEVKKIVDKKNLQSSIEVENQQKGVLIRFKDDMIFDTASAELKPGAKAILTQMSDVLKKYNKNIRVEGHSDNIPIKTGKYESNWELSSARAISVVKFLTSEIPPDKRIREQSFEVAGYGAFRPIVSNDTEKNREKNRRIELIIIK